MGRPLANPPNGGETTYNFGVVLMCDSPQIQLSAADLGRQIADGLDFITGQSCFTKHFLRK